jgi:hypothetical protein
LLAVFFLFFLSLSLPGEVPAPRGITAASPLLIQNPAVKRDFEPTVT